MAETLKTYPAPWAGRLVLACRKCQKKLKGDTGLVGLAKLKKSIKRYNKAIKRDDLNRDAGALHVIALHVIQVPCMDVCPKDGVTVYRPDCDRLSILRSVGDIEALGADDVSRERNNGPVPGLSQGRARPSRPEPTASLPARRV
jgi:hypothetical protein